MFNRRKISLALGMLTAVVLTAGALITSTVGTGEGAQNAPEQYPETVTIQATNDAVGAAD